MMAELSKSLLLSELPEMLHLQAHSRGAQGWTGLSLCRCRKRTQLCA